MHSYLLDTCIWSYWFNDKTREHARVLEHLQNLPPGSRLGISIITWGEIAYGHKLSSPKQLPIQGEYLEFIQSKGPKTFHIDMHTANTYGELRARLFDRFAPKKKSTGLRPEQLVDPITSQELGIQENDLWIAAQAVVRGLILVTGEKLSRIREVAGDDLRIKNWAV